MVQCCLCSSKRQRLCIPTISGRFVSSSLHIYPACSHCTAFLAPAALCFYCYSHPACIWLGFVSTERQGRYTLQLTQLLVGICETMIVIQIKQAKAFSNSSHKGFMVTAMKIYSRELCFKFPSVMQRLVFFLSLQKNRRTYRVFRIYLTPNRCRSIFDT